MAWLGRPKCHVNERLSWPLHLPGVTSCSQWHPCSTFSQCHAEATRRGHCGLMNLFARCCPAAAFQQGQLQPCDRLCEQCGKNSGSGLPADAD